MTNVINFCRPVISPKPKVEFSKWNGGPGPCPVSKDQVVRVVLRNGKIMTISACALTWEHRGLPSDIVGWSVSLELDASKY